MLVNVKSLYCLKLLTLNLVILSLYFIIIRDIFFSLAFYLSLLLHKPFFSYYHLKFQLLLFFTGDRVAYKKIRNKKKIRRFFSKILYNKSRFHFLILNYAI